MPNQNSSRVPLGVQMLSQPLALQKSSSLPNLQRETFSVQRDVGRQGQPFQTSFQNEALNMSATFSPGSTAGATGRMVLFGSWGKGPPKAGAYKKSVPKEVLTKCNSFEVSPKPATQFRRFYERHDLPIGVLHGNSPGVEWKVEPERLDYVYHLPIFFDGLLEKNEPYNVLAYHGLQDLINAAKGKEPSLLCPAIPSIILPLKRTLRTKDPWIICRAINILQLMLRADPRVGELLVPYYRQILPVFNLFRAVNLNLGDGIEYSQRKRNNIGDLVQETLELLERTGGEDAFINIKYMIPTYESCMSN